LGFDLRRFAFRRLEISIQFSIQFRRLEIFEENWDLRFDHRIIISLPQKRFQI